MKKGVKIAIFSAIGLALVVFVIFLVKKFKKTDKTEVPTSEQLQENPNPNGGSGGDNGTKSGSSMIVNAQRPPANKTNILPGTKLPGKGDEMSA